MTALATSATEAARATASWFDNPWARFARRRAARFVVSVWVLLTAALLPLVPAMQMLVSWAVAWPLALALLLALGGFACAERAWAVTGRRRAGWWAAGVALVAVSDTGAGVSEDVAGQLFQPFTTTKAQGMRVGLSISKSIIENHGGRIWVEANPKGGAVFKFTLPIAIAEDPADE